MYGPMWSPEGSDQLAKVEQIYATIKGLVAYCGGKGAVHRHIISGKRVVILPSRDYVPGFCEAFRNRFGTRAIYDPILGAGNRRTHCVVVEEAFEGLSV